MRGVGSHELALVIGVVSFFVGAGFLSPRGLPVMLGFLGVAEHVGGVGRFALAPSGSLVRGGGPPVRPTPALDIFVVGHSTRLAESDHRAPGRDSP
jgi:hypothetical protein